MKIILIVIFFLSFNTHSSDWTSSDTKHELAYQFVAALDWNQTFEIAENNDERNNILGQSPSRSEINRYFLATGLIHYGISRYLKPKNRRLWQQLSIAFESIVVMRNLQLGYRF